MSSSGRIRHPEPGASLSWPGHIQTEAGPQRTLGIFSSSNAPGLPDEQETGHDQLKTHLRGPGTILRSELPDLVHQELWAWLIVQYAMAALITRAAEAADIDPDRLSYTRALRIVRRTATGTAGFSP